MLPVSIISFLMGLLVAGYGSTVGNGAYLFATGFFLIGTIALLSHWRGHPAVV